MDYQKLGFKAGIEIHQQLDTHKLFCSCPCEIREDEPDVIVKRKMRAVAGELGNVDPAALQEFLRDRVTVYEAYTGTTCLVELDEEPPHELNRQALEIAIEVSLLLNATPVDEIQVMRKTVIDGSNTSGFQRTILVAQDGFVETSKGRIEIPTICLEEDAARKIKEDGNETTYRLDRLGIPLVEICTSAGIKDPEHVREVAEKLGSMLRSSRVKRGLGTIRQDVNVSIAGGQRIEVKGVQDLRLISKVAENEVARQILLIEIMDELKKRGVKSGHFDGTFTDLSGLFKNTKSEVIKKSLENIGVVMGVKLPGFAGLLGSKSCTLPGAQKGAGRLGRELAQYAKGAAGVKGIFHSDELPDYGITDADVGAVKTQLAIGKNDAFVLVAEKKDVVEKALSAVLGRAKAAFSGVPEETRRAAPDGASEFMRPLPGSARMYPETDEPLIEITDEMVGKIKKNLPKLPEEKMADYMKLGLNREMANQVVRSRRMHDFDELLQTKADPTLIATMLLSMPKEIKKKHDIDIDVPLGKCREILGLVARGKITKDAVFDIMLDISKTPQMSVDDIIAQKNLALMSEKDVEAEVKKIISENSELIKRIGDNAFGPMMGIAMQKFAGRADAKSVRAILINKLKK
ncbi:MAG: glutamyl-tRNA(Gln) amidotransferase subunit E [Candidatus Altiarchaeales archaeon IMC4]|nr:MAG: glutamyl-tRNA(Gln) amidotransferase subunit E [Candidatus Altiarchaeales archaeon IMC4]